MTHYFYYVSAGALCDNLTKVYRVALGEGVLGKRQTAFLQSYATLHGHYFNVVSNESDIFVRNLLDSLAEFDIHVERIQGADLVRLFKSAEATPLDNAQLTSADYQLKQLNLSYRIISNLNREAASSAKR